MTGILDTDSPGGINRPWLHRVAVLTLCAVFPLVFVGAGVTSNDAGMAYPDWPTSGGHLVNPPSWWQQSDTRWEHGHRLLGWTVGMLAIVLAVMCWRAGGVLRALGAGSLMAIIVQGLLGGLRVNLVSTPLAMVHGIWGQVCFCVVAVTALVSSRTWGLQRTGVEAHAASLLRRLCLAGTVAVFVQLGLGAALRHLGGNHALVAHLLMAVFLVLLLGWIAMWLMGQYEDSGLLVRLARALAILLAVQLLLGAWTFAVTVLGLSPSPFWAWLVPSGHVLVGALILVCCASLTLCVYRVLRPVSVATGSSGPAHTAPLQ